MTQNSTPESQRTVINMQYAAALSTAAATPQAATVVALRWSLLLAILRTKVFLRKMCPKNQDNMPGGVEEQRQQRTAASLLFPADF